MKLNSYAKFLVPVVLAAGFIGFNYTNVGMKDTVTTIDKDTQNSHAQNTHKQAFSSSNTIDFYKIKDSNLHVDTIEQRIQLVSKRDDLSDYDDEEILAAVNDPIVWDFSEEASTDDLPLDQSELEDGRTFFRASPARVAVSLPGDVLEVSLPDLAEPMLLDVVQVVSPTNGLVVLRGKVIGISGTFNMSQSGDVVSGHVNTENNTYSFEMFGETGWIHESGALFTGELPPVIDDEHTSHAGHSTLGSKGENIIAKGNGLNEASTQTSSSDFETGE